MANSYANVEDLQDRLGIPLEDDRQAALVQCVEAASRWIDTQTGRRFYTATETRYFSLTTQYTHWYWSGVPYWRDVDTLERPYGAHARVYIDDCLSVTQVACDEDGDGVYERVWTANTDYWLGPKNAPLMGRPYEHINRMPFGRFLFPLWENGVSITGAFGYATSVPTDVRELCLAVSERLARNVLDAVIPGAQTVKIGNDLTVTLDSAELPPLQQQTLANYKILAGVI